MCVCVCEFDDGSNSDSGGGDDGYDRGSIVAAVTATIVVGAVATTLAFL